LIEIEVGIGRYRPFFIEIFVYLAMQTTERKISELIPAEYNPRQLSDKQHEDLKASLTRFGAVDPAIVNIHPDRKDIIVGGHQRLKVAKSLGWETFPCVEVNLTRDQERELNVRLNKNTGSWDWNILGDLFQAEELKEWGFSDEELFGNIEVEESEAQEDNYEIPDEIETDIVLGDLIEIGEHRLLCGDSTDSDQVAKLMNGEKADMVFTDPPYGMLYKPNHSKKREGNYNGAGYHNVKNQEMIIGDDVDFEPSFLMDFFSYCKEQFWWGADYYIDKIDDFYKGNLIVWNKRFGIEEINFNTSHFELCWSKTPHLKEVVNIKWFGIQGTEQQDIRNRVHPTQKPIQLAQWFFKKYGKKNDIIADLFLGSGSTMVAAHQLNRKCYGMELDPKYCQVIIDRMLKLDPSLQVKINGE
jgi:DNA modification methylase